MIPYDPTPIVKIRTRSRDKLKIKIGFVISRLTNYINNTTSISLINMGLKKDFVHARKKSTSELYAFIFLNPIFCFVDSLCLYHVSYRWAHIYIINASFYIIRLYEIHKICLKFKKN
jgi:hypothetical protein